MATEFEAFRIGLDKIVKSFSAPPFLFVGSGLSMRYLGTPNWLNLLGYLVSRIASDEFTLGMYKNKARDQKNGSVDLPKMASLISTDFNERWYKDNLFRTDDPILKKQVEDGVTPIKAEVSHYLKSFSEKQDEYGAEIGMLKNLCAKSISGIITTNYDTFLDTLTGYTCYVGQSELLTSTTQGIAEIYKIHGSLENPKDLVFDEADYEKFLVQTKYLSAKLLTIFLEYPVVFLGYSITDPNIQKIFEAILDCLDDGKKALLKDRLFFIEYAGDELKEYEISSYNLLLGSRSLEMTKIRMLDYSFLYESLQNYQMKIPVRILRHLKQAFFEYTITMQPTSTIQVLNLEDVDFENEDILVTIGRSSDMSKFGLLGTTANEIYKDIFLDNLSSKFKADDILEVIAKLEKSATKLPKFKYIKNATKAIPAKIKTQDSYDDFLSKTTKDNRYNSVITVRSVEGILSNPQTKSKAAYYLQYLTEDEMDTNDLEIYLRSLFCDDPNLFDTIKDDNKRSDLRRVIRIYDFLKYKKSHE